MADSPSALRSGLLHAVGAYAVWGLLPAYFKLLSPVSPLEILGDRIIFSFALILPVLVWQKRLREFHAALTRPRLLGALAGSALFIGANWMTYIWAIAHDHVLAASLGYFLNPLINVLIGVSLLGERLDRVQWTAIAIAAVGVAILAAGAPATLGISLSLGISFAIYGLIRKVAAVAPLTGLAVETLLLLPFALAMVAYASETSGLVLGQRADMTVYLVASGAITAIPLVLFASGARTLPMVTLGLLQYLAPTLQFLLAIFAFGEKLSSARWASFALVWAGLALFAGHAVHERRRLRASVPA